MLPDGVGGGLQDPPASAPAALLLSAIAQAALSLPTALCITFHFHFLHAKVFYVSGVWTVR